MIEKTGESDGAENSLTGSSSSNGDKKIII